MPRPAWLIRSTRTRTVLSFAIAVQADGKILAGGAFTSIGGQTRNRIARLDPTTGLADSFNPNANGPDVCCNRGAGGRQDFSGRRFQRTHRRTDAQSSSPGSMPRPAWLIRSTRTRTMLSVPSRCRRTARFWRAAISPASADRRATASPGSMPRPVLADSFNPNANNAVYSIAVQADGKILAGGVFTSIGGQTRNHIARLDATTGLADSFNPNANGCCLFNRGAGGRQDFSGRRFHHARAERRSGGDAQPHRPAGNRRQARPDAQSQHRRQRHVLATAVQPDGKILIGGIFTSVLGVTRNNIARLNTDGTLDTAFNPNANSRCLFNRGAGGRQDFGGRHFRSEQHRRTDAQPHRPARCHDRLG